VSHRPPGRSSSADCRIKVLWLITGLGPGGAERLLVGAAPHVDRDRFDVSACYLLPWKDHLVGGLEAAGVPVRCLDVRRIRDPRWVGRLRGFLGRGGFDVVHAHLPAAGIGARVAARRMGPERPAVVYTEHNTWDRYRPVTRQLNARTFAWNDAAVAVSAAVARSIRAGAPAVEVIPNAVDAERLRGSALLRNEARAALGLPEDVVVVGTVGGISAKKDHVGLVRAARRVVDACPEARFVFVGLPIDPEPVRAEIAALGLGDAVTLAGYRPDAASLMTAFDVYCLPSRFEGMPVSLLEAMVLGLPSVATGVGGVTEVATSGEDAVVVSPGDPEAMAAALVELVRDPGRRRTMGERARKTAERFSLESMVRRVEAVYEAVLRRRSAGRLS
jgi:L-malate glycosyltransferase